MELSVVGKSHIKVDAPEKVTGRALYVDDLYLPNMLYGKILRSQYASAKILNIDTGKAKALKGVKAVITGSDLPDGRMGPFIKDEPVLAKYKVRYVGEPVAAVAAIDIDTASEALSLIDVDYEELPAVFDPIEAMVDGAPIIHEDFEKYIKVFSPEWKGNVCSHTTFEEGDIEKGFNESDYVVEDTFKTPMVHHTYLELCGALTSIDASGKITVWTTTQSIFITQARISESLLIPMTKIRVIGTKVGGGFGGKVEPTVQPLCAALTIATDRPVKIILTREEEFTNTRPRHPTIVEIKTGVKRDGTILAKKARVIYDTGAYADDGPGIAGFGAMMTRGPYRIPNVKIEGICVYTNKVKSGAFRGFGNPQGNFASEIQLDMVAEKIGMDPLEIRLKNAVEKGDTALGGQVLKSVGFKECLKKAAEEIGWKKGKKKKFIGRGMASINHISGLLSSSAFTKINEDGTAVLLTGAIDIGQGSDTTLLQIAAEELGVYLEDISIVTADTDFTPYNWATAASRVTYTAGNAAKLASTDAKRQLIELAADMLEARPEDLEARDKFVFVKGSPEKKISYQELSLISHWVKRGPIIGKGSFMVEGPPYDPKRGLMRGFPFGPLTAYIFGVHMVEVEVDTETGQVKILKGVAAHDVGKAINPLIVEGQIQGGFIQGIGYALIEELLLDNGRITNPTLIDYKIPNAIDVPIVKPIIVEEKDETGPFGAKGVGEPGLVGTAPAIANAIYDAIGVRIKELPITPEKIINALKQK